MDYKDGEYSSAHKMPSEFSHRILNPRMGGGYHDNTSQGSIQVTVGRVPSQQLTAHKDQVAAVRTSTATQAQAQEDRRKID